MTRSKKWSAGVLFARALLVSALLSMAAPPSALADDSTGRGSAAKIKTLRNLLKDRPMGIDGRRAGKLRRTLGVTSPELLRLLVQVAADKARPGISGFHVGAAALGKSGRIYLGSNVELPGHVLGQTMHAEQFAVTNARNHGERELTQLAVTAAPCGHCRQFLRETGAGSKMKVLISGRRATSLGRLLPLSFGPEDLGVKGSMLSGRLNKLRLSRRPKAGYTKLAAAALKSAGKSYAPYSGNPSGVALQTRDGKVFAGSYAENAAFNPSLSPLHGALVSLLSAGGDPRRIVKAVLVEKHRPKVSQRQAFKSLLKTLAPKASTKVYRASTKPASVRARPRAKVARNTRKVRRTAPHGRGSRRGRPSK